MADFALALFDYDGCTAIVNAKKYPTFTKSAQVQITWGGARHLIEVLELSDLKSNLDAFESEWSLSHRAIALDKEKERRVNSRSDQFQGYLAVWPSDEEEQGTPEPPPVETQAVEPPASKTAKKGALKRKTSLKSVPAPKKKDLRKQTKTTPSRKTRQPPSTCKTKLVVPQELFVLPSGPMTSFDQDEIKKLTETPGVTLCKQFGPKVTHVILKAGNNSFTCDRTLKYFKGIAHNCWLMDMSWVVKCNVAGHLLPEKLYMITGDTSTGESNFGPWRARVSTPLLTNMSFYLHGFPESGQISKSDVVDLIVACRGRVCDTLSSDCVLLTAYETAYETAYDYVDTVSEVDQTYFTECFTRYRTRALSVSWLLDSLSLYKLQDDEMYNVTQRGPPDIPATTPTSSPVNTTSLVTSVDPGGPPDIPATTPTSFPVNTSLVTSVDPGGPPDIPATTPTSFPVNTTSLVTSVDPGGPPDIPATTPTSFPVNTTSLVTSVDPGGPPDIPATTPTSFPVNTTSLVTSVDPAPNKMSDDNGKMEDDCNRKMEDDCNGKMEDDDKGEMEDDDNMEIEDDKGEMEDDDNMEIEDDKGEMEGDNEDSDWLPETDQINQMSDEEDEIDEMDADDDYASEIISRKDTTENLNNKENIVIQMANLNENGKRKGKLQCCLYCDKYYPRISRHYCQMHAEELDVAKILSLPKRSKERKTLWAQLVNKGNFQHNYEVLKEGKGVLITKYRPRKEAESTQYAPCEYCLGSFVKGDLWKHQKMCTGKQLKGSSGKHGNAVHNGRLLLPVVGPNRGFYENIFIKMRDDAVKRTIQLDPLIMQFADRLYEKNGSNIHQHQYIAQRLRELARLMIDIKRDNTDIGTLAKALLPSNWNKLIGGVRSVAGYKADTNSYNIPSLPLKLGHSLSKCAKIVRAESIIGSDDVARKNAEDFISLYESEWDVRISSGALTTLHDAKFNQPLYVPLAADVVRLYKYLENEATALKDLLKNDSGNVNYYSQLAEICLAQIILFNRKRSGEAQRITLNDYNGGMVKENSPQSSEVHSCLSKFEVELCKTHKRIEIKGKKGSKVAVILTEPIQKNLATLLEERNNLKDPITLSYIFAKPGNQHPIRGSDCLRKFSVACKAQCPKLLTSTKLRKHLATMTQILGLSENSQDILAKFMGHDIRIHREFYRLPDNTLELAKVAKILHLINTGTISQHKGQDFDDIEFDQKAELEEEDGDEEETENVDDEKAELEGEEEEDDEVEEDDTENLVVKIQKPKKAVKRHVWTAVEKQAIERRLGDCLKTGTTPGRLACINAIRKEPVLAKHDWTKIKHTVRNMITTRKRLVHHARIVK